MEDSFKLKGHFGWKTSFGVFFCPCLFMCEERMVNLKEKEEVHHVLFPEQRDRCLRSVFVGYF